MTDSFERKVRAAAVAGWVTLLAGFAVKLALVPAFMWLPAMAERTPADLAAMYGDALREIAPRAREARLLAWRVIREKRATFVSSPEAQRLRPSARTPVAGLALAGDWTDTGLPATIEGACVSGDRAAACVCA